VGAGRLHPSLTLKSSGEGKSLGASKGVSSGLLTVGAGGLRSPRRPVRRRLALPRGGSSTLQASACTKEGANPWTDALTSSIKLLLEDSLSSELDSERAELVTYNLGLLTPPFPLPPTSRATTESLVQNASCSFSACLYAAGLMSGRSNSEGKL
jgi:hypothetical protein